MDANDQANRRIVRGWVTAGLLATLALAFPLFLTADQPATGKVEDVFPQNQRLGRGVNILGYDPLWRSPDRARFKERHFKLIKEAGFNSVRINLHPFQYGRAGMDNRLSDSWFEILDQAVHGALANGLQVVLDFHEYQALGKDPQGNRKRFLAMWRQIAQHYHEAPPQVFFEILNEPNTKLTPALWNQFLAEALAVLRESNPTRTVIVGPASWNNPKELENLVLPPDDRNIIVTVHYYSPFPFTHQGATWAGMKDKVGVSWNGSAKEKQAIAHDFDLVHAWAQKHHRPIYLGEFGAYERGDLASRVRWTNFVARQAEQRHWSWAYWQFDNDFVVFDMRRQQWVTAIRDALIPLQK
jgi:endoglucanase